MVRLMELAEVLSSRRMARSFLRRPVPRHLLDAVLSAALGAPSAGGTLGWDLLVLEGPDQTRRFWEVTADEPWVAAQASEGGGLVEAPVLILPLADPDAYMARYRAS